VRARYAALISAAGTISAIIGVTEFVIANAAKLNGSVIIPGVLDITFLYNRGISFGFFAQDTQMGSRILILAVSLVIVILAVLAYRESRTIIGVGLGMIIGGALVNTPLDRAVHGQVFDYLLVHLGTLPLFVCNAPDIAISIGVLIWGWGEYSSAAQRDKPQIQSGGGV
jgi:lipoprotein signal peptidase